MRVTNKDQPMHKGIAWTTDELDQLSTILDEYQTHAAQQLTDLQQFYGSRLTVNMVELLESWIDYAAALRAKLERR